MSNYSSMSARIESAITKEGLCSLERSLSRVYGTGALTAREFMRLDGMIMDRICKLEMFSKGDKITIKDPDNFYFGREARVICGTDWPKVWQVHVNDVYIAINEKFMERLQ